MKKMLFVLLILMFALLSCGTSCNSFSHFPDKDDMNSGDPSSCLDYVRCLYYSSKAKGTIDCSKPYDRCDKDRAWKDCIKAVAVDKLPQGVTFQSCWDKKR